MTAYKLSAEQFLAELRQGKRHFSGITVSGDFVWDAADRENLTVSDLDLSDSTFTGRVDLGDLTVTGELNLSGATFMARVALYRMTAVLLKASDAKFHRGLGLVNSSMDYVNFARTRFAEKTNCFPAGLVIKHTSGKLLDLTDVWSPATIINLEECEFEMVQHPNAELGRRTVGPLGELRA